MSISKSSETSVSSDLRVEAVVRAEIAVTHLAEKLIWAADPVVCAAYQHGRHHGFADGEHQAGGKAALAADDFLERLAEDQNNESRPLPPQTAYLRRGPVA
ncbi:hypothetical protein [Kocuria rosea]|uniref:hypothetical protein n=1 Tax=Kocuria rosea TaxID=1275 RepID=UPI00203DAA6C|nr:hypothetical protein [Kocuria rosea]MCM3687690.1 hypothetical protein [Kocuria rosea]